MADAHPAVFGIYSARPSVEFAIEALSTANLAATDMSTLATGMAVGSLGGVLIAMGLPEYEARSYDGHVKSGGILLSVPCANAGEIMRAKEIMETTGGEHISSSGESMVDTIDFSLMGIVPTAQ